jgi:hypothetical protein
MPGQELGHRSTDRGLHREVAGQRLQQGARNGRPDGPNRLVRPSRGPAHNYDQGALARKARCHSLSQAARRTGYQRHGPIHGTHCHRLLRHVLLIHAFPRIATASPSGYLDRPPSQHSTAGLTTLTTPRRVR